MAYGPVHRDTWLRRDLFRREEGPSKPVLEVPLVGVTPTGHSEHGRPFTVDGVHGVVRFCPRRTVLGHTVHDRDCELVAPTPPTPPGVPGPCQTVGHEAEPRGCVTFGNVQGVWIDGPER